ncbi:MAG: DUF4956 domain-containing protein [Bacteroidota bacterium]
MFDQLLGNSNYYDFPSFEVAVYSLLLSFVLSAVIALGYRWTFTGDRFPKHFFRAIVLSSTVSSMVIMAVGNNLAAGFGIIGAIAIIRFRTLVRDPRNIIFIFASLSVGIATGVYGYAIALAGTAIFCGVAVLLHYSPFGLSRSLDIELSFVSADAESAKAVESQLQGEQLKFKPVRYRQAEDLGLRYVYRLSVGADLDQKGLFERLTLLPNIRDIRLSIAEEVEL